MWWGAVLLTSSDLGAWELVTQRDVGTRSTMDCGYERVLQITSDRSPGMALLLTGREGGRDRWRMLSLR